MTTALQYELNFDVYPQDLKGFSTWDAAVKDCEALGDGWRMPTKDELNQMYLKKETIGGFGAYYYWSSSEYYAYNAWYQNFSSGFQGSDDKHNYDRVRPVRDIPLTRDHDETVEARLRIDPEYAVALYHEQRKQIEELAESLDRSVKTTELHRTTSETAHLKYFELSSKYTAAVQRIEELEYQAFQYAMKNERSPKPYVEKCDDGSFNVCFGMFQRKYVPAKTKIENKND